MPAACGSSGPHGPHAYQDGTVPNPSRRPGEPARIPHMKACPGLGPGRPNPLRDPKK